MAEPHEANYLVVPITTPLQRVARADALAFVLVSLGDDDFVDFNQLRTALAEWPDRQRGSVYFDVRHRLKPGQTIEMIDDDSQSGFVLFRQIDLVRMAFETLARDAGFRAKVNAYLPAAEQPSWQQVVADFLDHAEPDATADESSVSDNLIEVFPVRTSIGRFENLKCGLCRPHHSAGARVRTQRGANNSRFDRAQLSAMHLRPRDKVAFIITTTEPSQKTVDGLDLLLDNRFWCDQLGFHFAGYRHL